MVATRVGILLITVVLCAARAEAGNPFQQCHRQGCYQGLQTQCASSFHCYDPNTTACNEATGCTDACGPPAAQEGFGDQCTAMEPFACDPHAPGCCPDLELPAPCDPGAEPEDPDCGPVRDPLAYGVIGLYQVKVDDFMVYADSGKACHFGTNCGITSKNGEEGVMNSSKALYPKGTQVVGGLTKWRARGGTAGLAETVFSNFWVGGNDDGVCIASGGRRLWCPPLLDAHAGTSGRDTCLDNDLACDDSGPIEDLWARSSTSRMRSPIGGRITRHCVNHRRTTAWTARARPASARRISPPAAPPEAPALSATTTAIQTPRHASTS